MNDSKYGRRNFLKNATASGAVALGLSQIVTSAYADAKPPKVTLKNNDVILFQGDSITDSGRNRDEKSSNHTKGLGTGYAFLASAGLMHAHPGKNLQIYNRGISGNKVYQLAERWDADCLDLKPTVLSILIGVNDFWHMINGKYDWTIETYHTDYKALLQRTRDKLPDVKLIIGEPFAVPGIKAVDEQWFPRFSEYQKAARALAHDFNATFIPYQSVFDKASKLAAGSYWTYDGVHPSLAGSQLMAQAVLANFSA